MTSRTSSPFPGRAPALGHVLGFGSWIGGDRDDNPFAKPETLDTAPVLQRSIRLRNPYVGPLSYIQIDLLERFRSLPEDSPERDAVSYPLLLSISAISSGLPNTG